MTAPGKKYAISWPQAVVLASVALALGLVYAFGPEDVRAQVTAAMGWAWGGVSTFLGPLVRRRLQSEIDQDWKELR